MKGKIMNGLLLGFGIGFAIWFFGLGWAVIKHIYDDDDCE